MKKYWQIYILSFFLLAGCTNTSEEIEEADLSSEETGDNNEQVEDTDTQEEQIDTEEESVDPIVFQETFEHDGGETEVEFTLYPIEREEDISILTMDYEKISGDGHLNIHQILSYPITTSGGPGGFDQLGYQIRLIDPVNFTAAHALFYQEQESENRLLTYPLVTQDTETQTFSFTEGEPVSYSAVFHAPIEDVVHVLIGNVGLIENIPVIDHTGVVESAEDLLNKNVPEETTITLSELSQQVYPLQSYHESLTIPVGTLTEEDQATITLASDILFDFDSSDLQEETTDILMATGEELARVDGGKLLIIGHTDNQGEEEYNLSLSSDRAESVLRALEEITDLSHFDSIETEGRAFHEPIASNDEDEGRALNRRVELHFTPPTEMIEVVEEETVLPEAHGPVIDFQEEEILEIEIEYNSFGVSIDSLKRLDGFIVGRIRLHNYEETPSYMEFLVNSGLYTGARRLNKTEVGGSQFDADGVTLVYGDQRVFPLDYWALTSRGSWDVGQEELFPLADRGVNWFALLSENDSTVATIIWPDVPTNTVTLDIGPTDEYDQNEIVIGSILGTAAWRIENVPIEDGNIE